MLSGKKNVALAILPHCYLYMGQGGHAWGKMAHIKKHQFRLNRLTAAEAGMCFK